MKKKEEKDAEEERRRRQKRERERVFRELMSSECVVRWVGPWEGVK